MLPEADTSTRHVEIRLGGRSIVIDARPGETVVDAARRSGLAVPYSCGRGTCCSCVARVVEGDVETESDAALEEWERGRFRAHLPVAARWRSPCRGLRRRLLEHVRLSPDHILRP
ncbi:MAG: 2Fe-2S iron-sulfur cluster binding domain-containing protein [Mesorhizobium sp.]|nr:MAG: 2Fe-2S iron-sulfur cluster binding domain-containing protein [Mesorhizobium sp.]